VFINKKEEKKRNRKEKEKIIKEKTKERKKEKHPPVAAPRTRRGLPRQHAKLSTKQHIVYLAIWHEHDGPARARSEKARHEHDTARCR
jgi:hypothetical protein